MGVVLGVLDLSLLLNRNHPTGKGRIKITIKKAAVCGGHCQLSVSILVKPLEFPPEPKFLQKIIAIALLSVTLCAPFPFEGEG